MQTCQKCHVTRPIDQFEGVRGLVKKCKPCREVIAKSEGRPDARQKKYRFHCNHGYTQAYRAKMKSNEDTHALFKARNAANAAAYVAKMKSNEATSVLFNARNVENT
jgi:hypothetical protein